MIQCYDVEKDNPQSEEIRRKYLNSVRDEDQNEEVPAIPISELKGLGVAACTEYAMLMQNCLAFLGYTICCHLSKRYKRCINFKYPSAHGPAKIYKVFPQVQKTLSNHQKNVRRTS